MSKKDNLHDFLEDLREGILTKKPDASRNPQNFRGEIEAIESKSPEWDGKYSVSSDTEIIECGECPAPVLVTKTVTKNGTYPASEDGADGYSEFTVAVPSPETPETPELGTEGLSYVLSEDGTYYSCNGIGTATDTDIVISPVYRGLPVKEIADESFDGNASITSVSIPNSIEYIGKRAFQNCTALTSIEIPNSVTKINYFAFNGCTALLSAVIGKGVEWIGDYVFQGCLKMATVTFANSGYNLAYMGQSVFNGCRSINAFAIPRGLTRLIFGTLYTNGGTKGGVTYQGVTSLVIPSNVKTLDDKAIASCIDLASVRFEGVPDSIGPLMFYNCKKLTDIHVPWTAGTFADAEEAWKSAGATIHYPSAPSAQRDLGFWFMTELDQEDREIVDEEGWGTGEYEHLGIKDSITVPPQVQDGSLTSFAGLFDYMSYDDWVGAYYLTSIWVKEICGVINAKSTKSLTYLFDSCSYTEKICDIVNTTNVEDFTRMFQGCNALTSVPTLDTRNARSMSAMFNACTALTSIPTLDIRNVSNATNMFSYCHNLENLDVKNIKVALEVGTTNNWGRKLTVDSLVGLCYELIDTGKTLYLSVGNPNIEKLANVYVKQIAVTDEMRAEDEFVDSKMPFVVCDSTDEGATLISDYIKFKNWALK